MTTIFLHHRAVVEAGMRFDGVTDGIEHVTGLGGLDTDLETLFGHPHNFAVARGGGANKEGLAGIAMKTVLTDGDINVDDIPFAQHAGTGNSVADLLVDRGTDGFWEPLGILWRGAIIERGWRGRKPFDLQRVALGSNRSRIFPRRIIFRRRPRGADGPLSRGERTAR